jgi:hypothetical protein
MLTTLPVRTLDQSSATSPRRVSTVRLSSADCLRSAIASAVFEVVWTVYHASSFAPAKLLREWCIGLVVGLLITLGERVVLAAIARLQRAAKAQTLRTLA